MVVMISGGQLHGVSGFRVSCCWCASVKGMDNISDSADRFRLAVALITRAHAASVLEDRSAFLATVSTDEEQNAGLFVAFVLPDARWPDSCPPLHLRLGRPDCEMYVDLPEIQTLEALILRAAFHLLRASPAADRPPLSRALQAELPSELRGWAARTLCSAPADARRGLILRRVPTLFFVPGAVLELLLACTLPLAA